MRTHRTSRRDDGQPIAHFGNAAIAGFQLGPRETVTARGGRNILQLVFVLAGAVDIGQRDPQLQLKATDWCICGTDQVVLSGCADADADVLVLSIPGCLPGSSQELIRSATGGVGNVLLTCIQSALQVADGLKSQARAELGQALDDLARLAIRECAGSSQRLSSRSVMRERVKAFVRHHLHDSNLSIDDIAQTFNCTKRYLHKVFSEDERSLNQYIWDLRLERCSQDLANTELGKRSITEIAFIWGFRSSPHFSRAFRQRFGASPSVYRSMRNVRTPRLGGLSLSATA